MTGTPRTPAAVYKPRRVYLELDSDLVVRLDRYAELMDRSRNSACRFLLHHALTQYERETGENTRPS